jgi:hypothetical protein
MGSETVDRRLIMRVLANWRGIAGESTLPRRSQIDPRLFGRDWSSCFMIDLDPAIERSRLAFVGDSVRDPAWPTFERQSISDCGDETLLQLATTKLDSVVSQRKPISYGGSAIYGEAPILYRCILLPLSEDGTKIDGVLGAVTYREVQSEHAIHHTMIPIPEPERVKAGVGTRDARRSVSRSGH